MSSSPVGQHGVGGGEAVVGHQLLRPLGVALLAEEGVAVLQSLEALVDDFSRFALCIRLALLELRFVAVKELSARAELHD